LTVTSSSLSPALDRVLGTLAGTRAASPAESWLQLHILDGVFEAAEWATQGVGADDVACAWLGALRWVRAVDGDLPDGAPVPPSRPYASASAAAAHLAGSGDPQNLIGLRSPEMSQPRRPFNRPAATVPELASTDGTGVLARAAALGLLAHAGEEDVRRLASWTAAFSHGSPAAHEAAADAAILLHALTSTGSLPANAVDLLDRLASGATPDAWSAPGGGLYPPGWVGVVPARRAPRPALTGTFDANAWEDVVRLAQHDGGAGAYAAALVGAVLGAERFAAVTGADTLDRTTRDLAEAFTRTTLG
jgi:hypothetical protein